MKINWANEVLPHILERLEKFEEQEIKPTLRAMFYALVSLSVIPNAQNYYKGLSKFTARAREAGVLEMDCFADNSRGLVNEPREYETIKDYVSFLVKALERGPEVYNESFLPMWHDQPNYVEVWVEKDALVGTFESVLKDKGVAIVPNRGFSSVSFMYDNVQRLQEKQEDHEFIHVLYFGDLDPSGDAIDDIIENKFELYGLEGVDFERIAITEEHVRAFNLPKNPDPDTVAKLRRDTRSPAFEAKYGELFQIEVDALQAYAPGEFKAIIQDSVMAYFDQDIWDEVKANHTDQMVRDEVKKELKKLLRRLNK